MPYSILLLLFYSTFLHFLRSYILLTLAYSKNLQLNFSVLHLHFVLFPILMEIYSLMLRMVKQHTETVLLERERIRKNLRQDRWQPEDHLAITNYQDLLGTFSH